ncbi:MAG: SDR family NAD(P)-dependent oxidoreductase [Bacteroidales bacterium]|nr:SDR family NAD(P)-dependent oxidoreductase [Bacteroidales bacterium]MDD3893265.1 SDR family NAD(P)-dependent oxidoreductase [Bacteroidales bacterium]
MKTAIVTGATSGIGKATAVKLAQNGFSVIITGRRQDKLDSLKHEIESQHKQKALPLCFDLRNMSEVESALGKLPTEWSKIDVLVNNAGLAVGSNHIQDGVIDDWERMIDTNVKGLLYVTKTVSKGMIERGSGHIVNIGSTAGVQVYESGNVYCATKHAVHALSQGMRIDMLKHGIKVTEVRPGLVETEFSMVRFKGDSVNAKKPYMGLIPLSGDDIADVILFAITRPAHVNLNDIEVTPTAQASSYYVFRK